MSWGYEYREYVPVGVRKAQATRFAIDHAQQQGRAVQPVAIKGKKIATTFWGKAWCDHLESYSDYANRLPRGRTYVRNGSVVDLDISAGRVTAIVAGSDVYEIDIQIDRLKTANWKKIRNDCSASIDSLLDLLGGRFSDGVMTRLTRRPDGLFPSPKEINMECNCPDWAGLCKHLAAVLYGVGAHLDQHPELLFLLRDVDHTQLVTEAVSEGNLSTAFGEPSTALAGEDLGAMFGIDLDVSVADPGPAVAPKKRRSPAKKKAAKKKAGPKASAGKTVKKKAARRKAASKKATTTPARAKESVGKKVVRKKAAREKVAEKQAVQKSAVSKKVAKKAVKRKGVKKPTGSKAVRKKAARSSATKKKAVARKRKP
ncbi:MAG: putative Zn finger protein [Planctomycetaceae bacterium]|jgi:uncharacterized Zn finger protein